MSPRPFPLEAFLSGGWGFVCNMALKIATNASANPAVPSNGVVVSTLLCRRAGGMGLIVNAGSRAVLAVVNFFESKNKTKNINN